MTCDGLLDGSTDLVIDLFGVNTLVGGFNIDDDVKASKLDLRANSLSTIEHSEHQLGSHSGRSFQRLLPELLVKALTRILAVSYLAVRISQRLKSSSDQIWTNATRLLSSVISITLHWSCLFQVGFFLLKPRGQVVEGLL